MGECFPWQVRCDQPLSMVLAGQTLVTGGHNSIAAYDARTGKQLWRGKAEGDVFGLAVSGGDFLPVRTGASFTASRPGA